MQIRVLDILRVQVQLRAMVGLEEDDRRPGRFGQQAIDRLFDPWVMNAA